MKPIYLDQPGDYSGDTWHVAAVLILNENVEIIQTVSKPVEDAEKKALQARALYCELGFAKKVRSFFTDENFAKDLKRATPEGKLQYLGRNEEEAKKNLLIAIPGIDTPIQGIYKSTSVIMHHLEANGLSATIERLRSEFTSNFSSRYPNAKTMIDEIVKSIPTDAVLVNGRFSNYTNTANLDANLFKSISQVVTNRDRTLPLIIVANKKFEPFVNKWGIKYDGWRDIYDLHPSVANIWGTGLVNMLGTAYFWSVLRDRKPKVAVIGGRSGSLDIASFMGLRTIAWDDLSTDDPECARHIIQSPFLNSIFHYNQKMKDDIFKYRIKNGSAKALSAKDALAAFLFQKEHLRPIYSSNYFGEVIMNGMEPKDRDEKVYRTEDKE